MFSKFSDLLKVVFDFERDVENLSDVNRRLTDTLEHARRTEIALVAQIEALEVEINRLGAENSELKKRLQIQ